MHEHRQKHRCFDHVPGWRFEPLWKIWKSVGMIIPKYSQYMEKKSGHVPVTTNQEMFQSCSMFHKKTSPLFRHRIVVHQAGRIGPVPVWWIATRLVQKVSHGQKPLGKAMKHGENHRILWWWNQENHKGLMEKSQDLELSLRIANCGSCT